VRSPLLVALCLFAAACGGHRAPSVTPQPPSPAERQLAADLSSIFGANVMALAQWGVEVRSLDSGGTLFALNPDKLLMPASNMKIVTSSVALEQLGPDFTYRTSFVARGPIRDSTLAGDLAVVGRGDPSISDHMWGDAMVPLHAMADSLLAHGIRRITGKLVAAGNAFPGPVLGYGWSWEDLESSYSAGVDELLFNEGFSEIRVHGGAQPGDPVRVETKPARSFPALRSEIVTIAAPVCQAGDSSANTPPCSTTPSRFARRRELSVRKDTLRGDVIVSGSVVAGDSVRLEITHRDPDQAYLLALGEALRDRGIVLDSVNVVKSDSAGAGAVTLHHVDGVEHDAAVTQCFAEGEKIGLVRIAMSDL